MASAVPHGSIWFWPCLHVSVTWAWTPRDASEMHTKRCQSRLYRTPNRAMSKNQDVGSLARTCFLSMHVADAESKRRGPCRQDSLGKTSLPSPTNQRSCHDQHQLSSYLTDVDAAGAPAASACGPQPAPGAAPPPAQQCSILQPAAAGPEQEIDDSLGENIH